MLNMSETDIDTRIALLNTNGEFKRDHSSVGGIKCPHQYGFLTLEEEGELCAELNGCYICIKKAVAIYKERIENETILKQLSKMQNPKKRT